MTRTKWQSFKKRFQCALRSDGGKGLDDHVVVRKAGLRNHLDMCSLGGPEDGKKSFVDKDIVDASVEPACDKRPTAFCTLKPTVDKTSTFN